MTLSYVDLHLHTHYSDGADAPEYVVERAFACGLAAIAVTDHDTIHGVEKAERAARFHGIEFLRATEISASFGRVEVHILGLGIDIRNAALEEALKRLTAERASRVDRILERLKAAGVSLERSDVEGHASIGTALGRVHIARALKARGITKTVQEGFDKFMRVGRKAYVPKKLLPCQEALDLIHHAGGKAILAHPGVGRSVQKLLPKLLALPFDGIEVYHTEHTPGHITLFTQVALERDLLISGGSDCHGTALHKEPDMGKVLVPYHHFQRIKDALRKY